MAGISFRQLFLELCGDAPTREFHHGHAFLVLDRGLSPAGARRLRDRRCLGYASGFPWPNPGVFSVPELAARILLEHERRLQRRVFPRAQIKPLQVVLGIQQSSDRVLSPLEALALWRDTKALRPLGVRIDDWKTLLPEFEKDSDPEFQVWTERVLCWLRVQALAQVSNVWASEWSVVEAAIQILSNDTSGNWPWARLLERHAPMIPPSGIELVVPAACEPWPLERAFLKAIESHLKVQMIHLEASDESLQLPLQNLNEPSDTRLVAIHWASTETLPSTTECAELLPGDFQLDVASPQPSASNSFARALFLFADFEQSGRPSHHAFLRGSAFRNFLSIEGLDCDLPLDHARLFDFLRQKNPELARDLPETPEGSLTEWIRVLAECSYLPQNSALLAPEISHPRIGPQGAAVLSLGDLALTGHKKIALWGTADGLHALCDAHSAENLKRRSLPARLASLLEASGYIIPDPSREALLLKGLLFEIRDHVFLLSETRPSVRNPRAPQPLKIPLDSGIFRSASDLEAFFKCPLRFHLERKLRLESPEEWDPPADHPLKMGSWIHKALELFFAAPDWDNAAVKLREHLDASLVEFFGEFTTESYRKVLAARAEGLAENLAWHVQNFERPLAALRREEIPLREVRIEGSAFELKLKGFLDRIDLLDDDHILVWDYKSGAVRDRKPETQIRNGRFQWFVYRELLKHLADASSPAAMAELNSKRVVGGGYLNPLDPSKSALFVVVDGNPHAAHLRALFENAGHKCIELDSKTELVVESQLRATINDLLARLEQGELPAKPFKDSECQNCSQSALCGRPYLQEGLA